MNVELSRVKISWMMSSPWCSSLLMSFSHFRQPCIAGLHPLQQQPGCLGNEIYLIGEQVIELLFTRQQSHREQTIFSIGFK